MDLSHERQRNLATRKLFLIASALLVAAGFALRVAAARGELWLDEIWTLLAFATPAANPLACLQIHHDNNHQLLTCWLWLLGPDAQSLAYRAPSLLAGTATIALAWQFARRFGDVAALAAAALVGSSFFMVTYSSEARGYALAGMFSLTAFFAAEAYLDRRSMLAVVGLAATVVLGIWSHLTFVLFYGALVVWTFAHAWRAVGVKAEFLRLLLLHAFPVLFLITWYLVDVRHIVIGGGDEYALGEVLPTTAGLVWGIYTSSTAATFAAAGVALVTAGLGCALLQRTGTDLWILFATLFAAPLLLLFHRPEALYERYFFIPILWLLMLVAFVLAWLWQQTRVTAGVAVVIASLIVATNGRLDYALLRLGRGEFGQVLAFMAERSGPEVHLVSDVEMRTLFYLAYCLPRDKSGHRFALDKLVNSQPQSPWVVLTDQGPAYVPPLEFPGYHLVRWFPHAGLSGFHFAVYRADEHAGDTR